MGGGEIVVIVMAGCLIMLVVCMTVIYFITQHRRKYFAQQNELQRIENEKQQEILKAVIRTQEEERSRIAASIHDSVGAELSMLKLNLSRHAYFFKKANIEHGPLSADIESLDAAIDSLRSICRDLYPVTLRAHGFIKTFEELIYRLNNAGLIVCKYRFNLKEHDMFPELELKLNLLRIMQEVINNLVKYAECTYIDIGFLKQGRSLIVAFKHNGKGFTNEDVQLELSKGKGVGLFSINNRINLMQGKIDYFRVNNGSEIIIDLPVLPVTP